MSLCRMPILFLCPTNGNYSTSLQPPEDSCALLSGLLSFAVSLYNWLQIQQACQFPVLYRTIDNQRNLSSHLLMKIMSRLFLDQATGTILQIQFLLNLYRKIGRAHV